MSCVKKEVKLPYHPGAHITKWRFTFIPVPSWHLEDTLWAHRWKAKLS